MTESLHSSDAIARELEALGEEPLSATELAMLADDDRDLEDEPAVASTARLIELSRPLDPIELSAGLSEIDQQRVWRTIEDRRAPTDGRSSERRSRRWTPWIAVSLALAAAAVMLVVLPGDRGASSRPSQAEVAQVGDQARSALRALDDGLGDTARAERLSADYQRRLEATR
jgi:hypothetical protein